MSAEDKLRKGRTPKAPDKILQLLPQKGLRWKDVAKVTGLPHATVTQAIRRLRKEGFIEAKVGADNRIHFFLTTMGMEKVEHLKFRRAFKEGIPDKLLPAILGDRERLLNQLKKLLSEISTQTNHFVKVAYGSRGEPIKKTFLILIRNRLIEEALNQAWNPTEIDITAAKKGIQLGKQNPRQYLIWWKTKKMTWEEGERLFKINNMPAEEYAKNRT
jgi:DNA-binding MarR family transcriptional regulator